MGTSKEMFEHGVRDAEQDDLNTFYYQHYYYYRQGYDQTRRKLRRLPVATTTQPTRPILPRMLVALAVLFGLIGGIYLLRGQAAVEPSRATGARSSSAALLYTQNPASPTRQPRTPTATAVPTLSPAAVLKVQGTATIVNLKGDVLRLRAKAGTKGAVVARLPEGTEVLIVEGPVDADGYSWWRVEAKGKSGWVAERSSSGVVWLQPK